MQVVNEVFNEIGKWVLIETISYTIVPCLVLIVIGVIVVVKIVRTSATKKQMIEYNLYKELANELKETNKEMREELSGLKEKVDSIEKMLKDVE